VSAKRCVNWII